MKRTELIASFFASSEIPDRTFEGFGVTVNKDDMVSAIFDLILAEYSRDSAYAESMTGSWSGTAVTCTNWYRDSSIVYVEAPTGQRPRQYIAPPAYELDQETGEVYLTVATGTAYDIRYRALHRIPTDESAITLASSDLQPFFKLAASKIFLRLAALKAETVGTPFQADAVNYHTKSGEYSRLAKDAYTEYRRMLGLPEKPTMAPAMVHVAIDNPSRIFSEEAPWPSQ